MTPTMTVSPKRVTRILTVLATTLVLLNVALHAVYYLVPSAEIVVKAMEVFDLDNEAAIPTWYQSATLLACSILLAIIALAKKARRDRYVIHWRMLSFAFLYLSIDETATLHEQIIKPLRALLHLGPVFYNAWVLVAIPMVLLFAVMYLKFLFHLPTQTRWLFIIAGLVYVGGAAGVDIPEGYYEALYGTETMTYSLLVTLEESLEMAGIEPLAVSWTPD
jgi:hypothetical protein